MPINFTQLFRDSWNFMRNQRRFVLAFLLIFVLSTLLMSLLPQGAVTIPADTQNISDGELMQMLTANMQNSAYLISALAKQAISLFVVNWGLMSIHQISLGNGMNLLNTAKLTGERFIGVALLSLAGVLLLLIGTSTAAAQITLQQRPSIFSLFFILVGIWLFVLLCLAPTHYLVGDSTLKNALKNTFNLSRKRGGPLFIYCVLIYFLLPLLSVAIAGIASNVVFFVVALITIGIINVFSMVFTYRFYTRLKQKAD